MGTTIQGGTGYLPAPRSHTVADVTQHELRELDRNGDGSIDLASEVPTQVQAAGSTDATSGAAGLKASDTDGDGKVSAAEFQAAIAKYDANADGSLSTQEFLQLHQGLGLERGERHHHGFGPRPGWGGQPQQSGVSGGGGTMVAATTAATTTGATDTATVTAQITSFIAYLQQVLASIQANAATAASSSSAATTATTTAATTAATVADATLVPPTIDPSSIGTSVV